MKVCTLVSEVKKLISDSRKSGKTIGFVPTMGALHLGHIALVEHAIKECGFAVVSIFVNPTQFNDKADLEKYPRPFENDMAMLQKAGIDVLFAPGVQEIYPEGNSTSKWKSVALRDLDHVMEGLHRPGHFKGVMQVVSRLFEIVEPDKAYFGQKDFQQLAVIREMVKQLNSTVSVIGCPTIREKDGLAMSSRITRLSDAERKLVPSISQVLFKVKELSATKTAVELKNYVTNEFNSEPRFNLEYFEIADATTLQPVVNLADHKNKVACVAVNLGGVRLIDNVIL